MLITIFGSLIFFSIFITMLCEFILPWVIFIIWQLIIKVLAYKCSYFRVSVWWELNFIASLFFLFLFFLSLCCVCLLFWWANNRGFSHILFLFFGNRPFLLLSTLLLMVVNFIVNWLLWLFTILGLRTCLCGLSRYTLGNSMLQCAHDWRTIGLLFWRLLLRWLIILFVFFFPLIFFSLLLPSLHYLTLFIFNN